MSKDDLGQYTIEDMVSVRDRPHVVEQLIYTTARDDPPGTIVAYPVDPGQAGLARANEIKRKLAEMGVTSILVRPQKSKRTRFLPFSAIAEAGYISCTKADWNDELFVELEEFTGLKQHERDDIPDACSDAIFVLNKNVDIPNFSIPDLSTNSNSFGFQTTDFNSGLTINL
jgi:predicted phage terminase large subunit-like protein